MDLLAVARQCHNDDPWTDASLTPFYLSDPTTAGSQACQIGFLLPAVVEQIRADQRQNPAIFGALATSATAVWIDDGLLSNAAKSEALASVVQDWRRRGVFPDPLDGWRDELYSVYGPNRSEAFRLERASCSLFGLTTFGVHCTAYTVPDYRIWVPRRSATKATFPSMLDNSAAGGISAGDRPFESMVRECGEEAGLADDVVRKTLRQTGVVSYFYKSNAGWVQPEVEYTYDLPLDSDVRLEPADGEAESFALMSKEEVLQRMRKGEFKPNCALILLDFFIRHGLLKFEDCDCDFTQLVSILHNDVRLPGP